MTRLIFLFIPMLIWGMTPIEVNPKVKKKDVLIECVHKSEVLKHSADRLYHVKTGYAISDTLHFKNVDNLSNKDW